MNYFHNRQVLQRDFKRLMQKTRWKVFCEVTFTVLISFNERQKFCFTFLLKQVRTIRLQTAREWTQTYSFFSFPRILVYFFFPLILNCLRNPSFCGPIAEQAWANNCHISCKMKHRLVYCHVAFCSKMGEWLQWSGVIQRAQIWNWPWFCPKGFRGRVSIHYITDLYTFTVSIPP